jgi:hypothetical protein
LIPAAQYTSNSVDPDPDPDPDSLKSESNSVMIATLRIIGNEAPCM